MVEEAATNRGEGIRGPGQRVERGAAGALNATRHGLGSGNRSAVERLVGAVKIQPA